MYVFMYVPTGELALVAKAATETDFKAVQYKPNLNLLKQYRRSSNWVSLGKL